MATINRRTALQALAALPFAAAGDRADEPDLKPVWRVTPDGQLLRCRMYELSAGDLFILQARGEAEEVFLAAAEPRYDEQLSQWAIEASQLVAADEGAQLTAKQIALIHLDLWPHARRT